MPRRYDDYRLKLGDDIGDPEVLNSRFRDLDMRVLKLEDVEKDWSRALAALTTIGLERINEVLLPAYQEIRRLADLGAVFTAHSDTELLLEPGLKRLTIRPAERDSYAPAGYVAAFVEADPARALLGQVISYDRASGVLEIDVDQVGGEGSGVGWVIYASPATDAASARAEIAEMRDTILGHRDQTEGFYLAADADAATATAMRDSAVAANTSAQSARTAAESARDDTVGAIAAWDAAVLGVFAVAPTTRQGGAPLQVGDQYFHSDPAVLKWKTWDGTQWTVNAIPGGAEVGSVFGRIGAVEAQSGDYRGDQIGRTAGQQAALAGANVEAALITVRDQVAAEAAARGTADANLDTVKANKTVSVTAAGLATGGGDLSADRTITVTEATQGEAEAGTAATAMTARRVKQAIDALVPLATTAAAGKVELATTAEGLTGTSAVLVPPVAVTKAMIDAATAALAGAAPGVLDTLGEIAAALGNDANFSSTVTGLIAAKLNASAASPYMLTVLDDVDATAARTTLAAAAAVHGHAIADITGLQASLDAKLAAASYTASDVLTKVKTVDGSGSGLDADVVRGTTPSAFGLARLGDADAAAARAGLVLGSGSAVTFGSLTAADVRWGSNNTRTETCHDAGAVNMPSRFGETSTPAPAANWPPGATSWWHIIDCRHSNLSLVYAMQFASSFFAPDIYCRVTNGLATTTWNKLWHSGNAPLDANLPASGGVLQSVSAVYTTYTVTADIIPWDDTVPLITEGIEILAVTITPRSAASKLRIRYTGLLGGSGARLVISMFLNGVAVNAAAVHGPASQSTTLSTECEVSPGSTAPQTITVRGGVSESGYTFITNGRNSSIRLFGGIARNMLVVEEIAA